MPRGTSSSSSSTNGPEPGDGSWVVAATGNCPDRLHWQRRGDRWLDAHGCRREWDQLVEPVDALEPVRSASPWQ